MLRRTRPDSVTTTAAVAATPTRVELLLKIFQTDPELSAELNTVLRSSEKLSADRISAFAATRFPAITADLAIRRAYIGYSIYVLLDRDSKFKLEENIKNDVIFAAITDFRRKKLANNRIPAFTDEQEVYAYLDDVAGLNQDELETLFAKITTGLQNTNNTNAKDALNYITTTQATATTDIKSTVSGLLGAMSTIYKDGFKQEADKFYTEANADQNNLETFGRKLGPQDFFHYTQHKDLIEANVSKLLTIKPREDVVNPDERDDPQKGPKLYKRFNAAFRKVLLQYETASSAQKVELDKQMQSVLGKMVNVLRKNGMGKDADAIVAAVFPGRVNRIQHLPKLRQEELPKLTLNKANQIFAYIKSIANTVNLKLLGQDNIPAEVAQHIGDNPGLTSTVNKAIAQLEANPDLNANDATYEPKRRLINRWLKLQASLQDLAIDNAAPITLHDPWLDGDEAERLGIDSSPTILARFKTQHNKFKSKLESLDFTLKPNLLPKSYLDEETLKKYYTKSFTQIRDAANAINATVQTEIAAVNLELANADNLDLRDKLENMTALGQSIVDLTTLSERNLTAIANGFNAEAQQNLEEEAQQQLETCWAEMRIVEESRNARLARLAFV